MHHRRAWALVLPLLAGCSDWSQVKNAHDVEGQLVHIETGREQIVIDEVVVCDKDGFLIADRESDCKENAYDTRREKVMKHDKDTKGSVGLIVTGILTAIFVPAAIVGSAILSQK